MERTTDYSDNILLLRLYKDGDKSALEKLTKKNMNLVRSIAQRFVGRGHELDDLIETGVIGLLKALDGFDEALGYSFSTYAFPLITGEIKRFLRDDGPIKISRKAKANTMTVIKAKESFIREHNREPKLSELSKITCLSAEDITEAIEISRPIISLQDKISDTDGEMTVGDTIADIDTIDCITDKLALRQAIASLSTHEKKIILLRYFRNLTQTKVSELLGVSQVTVSRTEKKIIDKLRQEIL